MLGFKWWKIYSIFFYITNLLFWIGVSSGFFDYTNQGFTRELFLAIGLTFGLLSTLLIYSLSFSRTAFILITVFSLNPIIWLINYFYIKNRWQQIKELNK